MLAVQILVLIASLLIQPTTVFDDWIWHLDREANIPSMLASTQLALVGGVSLAAALLRRARAAQYSLYLIGIAVVFLYLAWDEYFALHEYILNWQRLYALFGALIAASTVMVASRSPRRTWIWHVCLLMGLVMSATGAMLLGTLQGLCEASGGGGSTSGCTWNFYYEESLEFLGIWLTLVAMLGQLSEAVSTPTPRVRRALFLLPLVWLFFLLVYAFLPRLELGLYARSTSIEFDSGIYLRGFYVAQGRDEVRLQIYASARQPDYIYLGYGIHIVDQVSGKSVASSYRGADLHHSIWYLGPNYMPVYRQLMDISLPPQPPTNRALSVVLTLWHNLAYEGGERRSLAVLNSDRHLLSETQVVLEELVLPADSLSSPTVPVAVYDNGFALDPVTLPKRARIGETLSIQFTWRSDAGGSEDHAQFLHFRHDENGTWFVYDQQPLGPRLPTRLWYSGLVDSETWAVPLPADLAPGRYYVFTGLYHARDQERVPASDGKGEPFVDARVPLGALILEEDI